MKILQLKTEAFSSSMPQCIKDWMQQNASSYIRVSRASALRDFDPASATFQEVSHLPVNKLREYLKAGEHVLFAYFENFEADQGFSTTVAMCYDTSNKSTNLLLVGDNAQVFKEKSFKWICENATSLWSVRKDDSVTSKRKSRNDARKGLVARKGDSAQNSEGRYTFNGEDWKQDASGYMYDANRLATKLAKLHENDSAYYTEKAAETFSQMVNTYAEIIQRVGGKPSEYTRDTFGVDSLPRIFRDGQRLLEDAVRVMDRIQDDAQYLVYTLEDWNARRAENGNTPLTQEEFDRQISRLNDSIGEQFTKLKQYQRQMQSVETERI